MKKSWIIIVIVVILVLAVALIVVNSPKNDSEDNWVKDERGVWIKHGAPAETPDYVEEQQQVIEAVLDLYGQKKAEGMQFSSQCLGTFDDYAIDIVHVPRNDIDNLAENQCQEYREGKVSRFIELDENGEIVRIK